MVTLRVAGPDDAELIAGWREEPSAGVFQPLRRLSVVELRARLAAQGMEVRGLPPERLREFLAEEIENWGRVVRLLGITPQ